LCANTSTMNKTNTTKTETVEFHEAEMKALKDEARRRGEGVNDVLRRIVAMHLERRERCR
jgi:hypothetical protein